VVGQHPCGGRAIALYVGEVVGDDPQELVGLPVRLEQVEVEGLSQPVRAGVSRPPGRVHPRFRHAGPRRVVLVEDPPPFGVYVVHFVAVPERMIPVRERRVGQVPVDAERLERLGQVLGQAVRHVYAEPVDPAVGPEPQGGQEVIPDLAVRPVEVGLLGGEQVQVPLPVRDAGPGRAAEHGGPVRRGLRAVWALSVAEDVPVPGLRSLRGGQRLTEPGVPVRGVIRHDVDDDLDPPSVQAGGHLVEIGQRAKLRVDVAVVVYVIAAVREARGVERAEPDRVDVQ